MEAFKETQNRIIAGVEGSGELFLAIGAMIIYATAGMGAARSYGAGEIPPMRGTTAMPLLQII